MNKYYLLLRPPGNSCFPYSDITFEQCQAILRAHSHPIPILAEALVSEGFLITVKTDGGIYSIWMTPVPPLDLSSPTKRLYVDWLRLNFAFLHQAVTRLESFQAVRLFDVRPSEVRFVWHGAEKRGAYLDQPYTQRPISDWIRGFAAQRYRYDQFQRRDLTRWRKDLRAPGIYCAVWFDPVYKQERFYVGRMTRLDSRWNPGKNTILSHGRAIREILEDVTHTRPDSIGEHIWGASKSSAVLADFAMTAALVQEGCIDVYILEEVLDRNNLAVRETEWILKLGVQHYAGMNQQA